MFSLHIGSSRIVLPLSVVVAVVAADTAITLFLGYVIGRGLN
jgi:hypothetical protein